jgi:hypothetical protein
MNDKAVITIATSKRLYLDMAVNLARSFILWNKDSGIDFYLATDMAAYLPADVKEFVRIIDLRPGELGIGFTPKLHLDKLALAAHTLFIDSDCLVYGNLLPIFKKFKGLNVGVVGNYISSGEWFGDVSAICRQFNVSRLPKFNGGIYYIEPGVNAKAVYQTARELENRYDEIGFVRLRNRPNDEVVMALAMELHKQSILTDDGSIMAEFVNFKSGIKSELVKGKIELYNNPKHPDYQPNWPLQMSRPLIVHFLGHHNQILPYTKESRVLKLIFADGTKPARAQVLAWLQVALAAKTLTLFKDLLRPFYHAVAGPRKVKQSERVIQ